MWILIKLTIIIWSIISWVFSNFTFLNNYKAKNVNNIIKENTKISNMKINKVNELITYYNKFYLLQKTKDEDIWKMKKYIIFTLLNNEK